MALFEHKNIRIAGIACAVPKNVIHPEDYEDVFGVEEVSKFKEMTGIKSTRRASKYQTASDLGYTAANNLLNEKNIDRNEIGAVVFATHSPDYRRPASAFILHKRLEITTEAAVFDLALGCSSVVYGIQVVASMMNSSDIEKALLISGDTGSKTINPKDRASIMLGGDAGIAILLEKSEGGEPILSLVRSDGNGYRYLIVPAGGYRNIDAPRDVMMSKDGIERSLHDSFMQGTSVFTFTVFDVPKVIKDFWKKTETNVDSYDCYAFHQANHYILRQIAKKLKIPTEKMPLTLSEFGNTSGASSIVSLCNAYGNVKEGKLNTIICGFGVGLSWGVTSVQLDISEILPIVEDDTIFEEAIINSPLEL